MTKRLLLVCVLGACNGASSTGIAEVSCPPDSTLTYTTFGQPLIAEHCLSCHDSKSPALDTQAAVQRASSSILDAAVYTSAMPEDHDIPLALREQLGEWLACGAP